MLLGMGWIASISGAAVILVIGNFALRAVEPSASSNRPAKIGRSSKRDTGYRGIWFTLGQKSKYGDKYSGGFGTYTANHVRMAIYSKEANKTFFVYGGARDGKQHLLDMVSYYDHASGNISPPEQATACGAYRMTCQANLPARRG